MCYDGIKDDGTILKITKRGAMSVTGGKRQRLAAGEMDMGQLIKSFSDGSFLEYDRGGFDDWCVYFTRRNEGRQPPRDVDYFGQLKNLANKYGARRIYRDYVRVYDMTKRYVEKSALVMISRIAAQYESDALEVDVVFSILYMAMIAEERKKFTRLGKRIKRLGIYMLLMENRGAGEAAGFTRGMGWRDIARLCEERGF